MRSAAMVGRFSIPFPLRALRRTAACCLAAVGLLIGAAARELPGLPDDPGERVWIPDNADGTYCNPVIHADYSDPDVIRVGNDYYMTSSSFSHFPGLPILHSRDLVNWRIIGHALPSHPSSDFTMPQQGKGVWAPSIRCHEGEFRIYFGDPDRGVYMTRARDPAGPWETPALIRKVTGWIDPCPFWDEDGNAYLIHAFANSRVGVKSILVMNRMNREGTEILDDGIVVFVGHRNHPTIEGPKLYRRNGFYYIFAPAGGVKTGWQTVLRSRDIFGPYEDRIVLEQGTTRINGPHQGAWVDTPEGEHWFVHFQDRYAYGRLVHLQPMRWENDWPAMGVDYDRNGVGEPVETWTKPFVRKSPLRDAPKAEEPQTCDEFDGGTLGLQWQWEANPCDEWYSLEARKGWLRLYPYAQAPGSESLWHTPSLLLQKLPAPSFSAAASVSLSARNTGERVGLTVHGLDYAYVALQKETNGFALRQCVCKHADKGGAESVIASIPVDRSALVLKVHVYQRDTLDVVPTVLCRFEYSLDGKTFQPVGREFTVREGRWVGAKLGLFAVTPDEGLLDGRAPNGYVPDGRDSGGRIPGGRIPGGYADCDWFRFYRDTKK